METAFDGHAGLAVFRDGGADLILPDLMLPGLDGPEVCRRVRRDSPARKVTALTGLSGCGKSIYENVASGPRLTGLKDKAGPDSIVEDSLKRAAPWDEVRNTSRESGQNLSGGQQQRLCVARVIAVQPEAILSDELVVLDEQIDEADRAFFTGSIHDDEHH